MIFGIPKNLIRVALASCLLLATSAAAQYQTDAAPQSQVSAPSGGPSPAQNAASPSPTPTARRRKITYGSKELRPLLSRATALAEEDKYDEALMLETKALNLVAAESEPDKLSLSLLLEELGFLQYSKGDYAAAELTYERAFRALDEWRASLPLITPTQDQSLLTLDKLSADKRMHRAMLFMATGRNAQALPLLASIDRDRERDFVIVADHISENDKLKHMGNIAQELDIIISFMMDARPSRPEAAALAATAVLRRKGRVLDALSESLARLRQQLTPEDVRAINEVTEARALLSQLPRRNDLSAAERLALTERLKVLLRDKEQALGERSARYHLFWQPVTIESVRQAIPAGAALVEFVKYRAFNSRASKNSDRWGAERYVAFILKPTGQLAWVDIGAASPIEDQVMRLRTALRRPPDAAAGSRAFADSIAAVREAARTLDTQIMQPIRKLLGPTRDLFIVPDGQLNLAPFAALVDERGDYLLRQYSITYLSSGRDLTRLQESRPRPYSAPTVFAYPAFDGPSTAVVADEGKGCSALDVSASGASSWQAVPAGVADKGSLTARDSQAQIFDLGTIGNTLLEAQDICALLPGTRLFVGGRATESALKDVQGPQILHVATHGFFRPDRRQSDGESQTIWLDLAGYDPALSPMRKEVPAEDVLTHSGLALANANRHQNSSEQDGILTALEASGLNLWGTQLAVLSACSTGLGDIKNGEGFYGLRRALVVAGAESQMISLWNVNDEATRRLVVNFYRLLLYQRRGRSKALRLAQLEMANGRGAWAHPYYWAGFVMSGAWTSLANPDARPRR
jgi:CHAT domain-containing protein/tetratricopeptide (TPR) repeat protein